MRQKAGKMITLDNIYFAYPVRASSPVFSGLTAAFPTSENSGLTGANGSGKTTLAQLIMGIHRPKHGLIAIDGQPVHEKELWQIGRQIGYLMQNPRRQLFAANVFEELIFPFTLQKRDTPQIREKAEQFLQEFKLWPKRAESPHNLSSGEQKRLALAAVLIHNPSYLILDEPNSGLDQASRTNVIKHLKSRRQKGLGMLLISHEPAFLAQLADKQYHLAESDIQEVGHDL